MEEKKTAKHSRTLAGKITRIFLKIVLILIVVITAIALLVLTPPVQNFIRGKATAWLGNKLNTKVEVGRMYISFPKNVVLEDIYIEDQQKDTLLSGGKVKVDVSMLKLLKSELEISNVELTAITAKIKRELPDTIYNFQFIIDAFAPTEPQPETTDSSSMRISVKNVILDRIRMVYDDAVTGNDMTIWLDHFDTKIDLFDLDKMAFDIPETTLRGLQANIYQHKPLVDLPESPDDTTSTDTPSLNFNFGKLNIDSVLLDYGNDISALYARLNLGKLVVKADELNLPRQTITLDMVLLENTTAAIRLGKNDNVKAVADETEKASKEATDMAEEGKPAAIETENGWRILVKKIELNNNNFALTNDNEPPQSGGMDYAHLDATGLTLHAHNFIFSPDSIGGSISKGQVAEKSGFQLNTLETDFLYANNQAYLRNLLLETPGTTLKRSAEIHYPSMKALQKDIGQLQLNIDLNDSRIQVKDILTFVPSLKAQSAFSDPAAFLILNGRVSGKISDLNIQNLQLRAFNNTQINLKGRIAGLPDVDKLRGNLMIGSVKTSRKDITLFAPSGSIPQTITLPEAIDLRGSVSGSMADAKANLQLTSSLGNASIEGSISHATDKKRARYNGTLIADRLDLGTIMQNDSMFGLLTAAIKVAGTGFDPKTASTDLEGVINSVVLNRYDYKDIRLNGKLANQQANITLAINDPNIKIDLKATGDLSPEFPAFTLDATIDNIKTMPLNFTTEPLAYRGQINANFPRTNPEDPEGELFVTNSVLNTGGKQYKLDTIAVTAGTTDTGRFVRLNSASVNLALTGKFNPKQLGAIFQQAIQPYYAIGQITGSDSAAVKDSLTDYALNINGQIVDGPLLRAFIPTLTRLDPINITGRFTSDAGWQSALDAPLIIMGANRIQEFTFNAAVSGNAINVATRLGQFSTGPSMTIYSTSANAKIADNNIDFLINLKDQKDKNKYRLGGSFHQPEQGVYALALDPAELLLNYDKWDIANDNSIKLNMGDININNFAISKNGQELTINSSSQETNSPLEIKFNNFRIGTIAAIVKQDSLLADGSINGQVVVENIAQQPTFTSDLTITDLMMKEDTVGNLAIKVSSTTPKIFNAGITLSGKGNDIAIDGEYRVKPGNQSVINLVMDMRKLQMTSVEALSMGAVTNATGWLNGKFNIQGTFEKPDVNGELNFNQTGFVPAMLGSFFTINDERISVNNQGIHFDSFTILDSAKNELNLDGYALTTDFTNYKLDLNLTAENFQALNNTKQSNQLFYGQFYFDTDLQISGTGSAPEVEGALIVNENTKLTVVLPQGEPGVAEREGVIRFIDMDSAKMDTTLTLAAYDSSMNKSAITGMDISVNIEINKEAELTLIIDEGNGDFLQMKGTAQLTGGIDRSGKTTLTGSYEIEEGAYQVSLNLIKRKFDIKKGGKITWLGEPTRADVDLTAIYVANTAPLSLVEDQIDVPNLNMYKQRLPFEVNLILSGELLKPEIKFDITLPDNNSLRVDASVIENVEARLTQLKSEPSELNKQVFALLLLNRFVSENPFASSGGSFNAGTMARQSVSKILTEQLNNLAADLISGVNLNFDMESTEDYTTGSMENRTDLNVSLSKELLNDRLKVTVGSNFELEGPQRAKQKQNNLAGNVALDYMLSKDGRYLIRAYRKNEYEGELDGYIIETGLNFILTFDYDKLREIFHSPKPKGLQIDKKKKNMPAAKDSTDSTTTNEQMIK